MKNKDSNNPTSVVSQAIAARNEAAIRWEADAILRRKRLDDAHAQGSNRHILEQTRILRDVIDADVLADEPIYADTRWAQYGYVSAFDATEDFTRLYVQCYERWRKKYVDRDPHPCPVHPDFVSNHQGMMNALYCARQFADSLGIPYQRFIVNMFERLMTVGSYRRVPMPSQLYPPRKLRKRKSRKKFMTKSGKRVDHKALRHGRAVQEAELPKCDVLDYNWDPRFFASNYIGDPAQQRALRALATHETLFRPLATLTDRLAKGRISVDMALSVFPKELVDKALERVGSLPEIEERDPALEPYRPHCIGLIQAETPAAPCGACVWRDKCIGLAERAEQEQRALTGYANRSERERDYAARRKREERARKKETAPGAPNGGASP